MAVVLKTTVEVLAAHYGGREFNSPNDIVCDSRDRIWFIDPAFGRTNPRVGVLREQQLDFQGVFRIETDGNITLVADDFAQPNGLCLAPGEDTLLVNDTERRIRRFVVHVDGSVSGGEVFATIDADETGKPDGMKVDVLGASTAPGRAGSMCFRPRARCWASSRRRRRRATSASAGPISARCFSRWIG